MFALIFLAVIILLLYYVPNLNFSFKVNLNNKEIVFSVSDFETSEMSSETSD